LESDAQDYVGRNFLTSFTIVFNGTPSDWVLKWSRFLLEAIVCECGRRAKSINGQIEGREIDPFCKGKGDNLFAPNVKDEARRSWRG
jgi:hypothetical protein